MNIDTLCIVGGGTSGWMLATALEKHLPQIKVTLVESPEVGNIGVGESTVPGVSRFINDYLGFEEKEWMPYCDAVYKASIKFNDFKRKGHSLYHPFWTTQEGELNGLEWAVKKALSPDSTSIEDYYYSYYSSVIMSRDNKFEKLDDFNYAHHLDATKFGKFCKSKCNATTHVVGHISEVPLDSEGAIVKLILKDGREITSDLYVDCTGFTSLLLGKTLKEEFVYSKNYLLNDKAVVARVPYNEGTQSDEMLPYTDCTALSSGWAWNIPLWSRVGAGYVYSGDYLNKDEAEVEFKDYLKGRFGDRVNDLEFNHINIKAGRHKRAWVHNCASLVLSTGFVEPLESTGLVLMTTQVETLVSLLSDNKYNSLDREVYNTTINKRIDGVVDFISLHYSSTDRDDSPYWKFINKHIPVPSTLLTSLSDLSRTQVFPHKSWENILIGFEVSFSDYYNKDILAYNNTKISDLNDKDKESIMISTSGYIESLRSANETRANTFLNHFKFLKTHIYTRT